MHRVNPMEKERPLLTHSMSAFLCTERERERERGGERERVRERERDPCLPTPVLFSMHRDIERDTPAYPLHVSFYMQRERERERERETPAHPPPVLFSMHRDIERERPLLTHPLSPFPG